MNKPAPKRALAVAALLMIVGLVLAFAAPGGSSPKSVPLSQILAQA